MVDDKLQDRKWFLVLEYYAFTIRVDQVNFLHEFGVSAYSQVRYYNIFQQNHEISVKQFAYILSVH